MIVCPNSGEKMTPKQAAARMVIKCGELALIDPERCGIVDYSLTTQREQIQLETQITKICRRVDRLLGKAAA